MKFINFIDWLNENNNDEEITVLIPGSFKILHAGHIILMRRYANYPNVKEVIVLIGSGIRNGITQKTAKKVAELLLKYDEKIKVKLSEYPSPITTIYKYIETAKPGTYAMGAAEKDEGARGYQRVLDFVKGHSEGGKYFHLKPQGVNVIELKVDSSPLLYKGRTDEYDGEPISGKILRQDILNDDYNNFRTNYPRYDENIIQEIWGMTQLVIKESLNEGFLFEGGNVFEGTGPIPKENIEPTLIKFKQTLNKFFPKVKFDFELLGSAGKKAISGDIDLALSEKTIFDDNEEVKYEDWNIDPRDFEMMYNQIRKRAKRSSEKQSKLRAVIQLIGVQLLKDPELSSDTKGSGSGTLFCSFPQYNKKGAKQKLRVQIDINIGDLHWLKFSYHSETYESNVKGLHRTQLMVALFKNKERTFRHGSGVVNLDTEEYEARTPEEALDLLNNLYGFKTPKLDENIIGNFFKLHKFLIDHISEEELNNIYDIYLKILDSTRADIPEDIQYYWIANQDRLGLRGAFLPEDSKLNHYKK